MSNDRHMTFADLDHLPMNSFVFKTQLVGNHSADVRVNMAFTQIFFFLREVLPVDFQEELLDVHLPST